MQKSGMTIIDIARLAKVSTTTVSRVINEQCAKRSTKERVAKIIERYGYYPNTYAQYLGKRNHAKSIRKIGSVSNKFNKIV